MKLSNYKSNLSELLVIKPKIRTFYIRNIFSWDQKNVSKYGEKKDIILRGIGFLLTQESRIKDEANKNIFTLIKLTCSQKNEQWAQILKAMKIEYNEKQSMLEEFRKKICDVTCFKIQTAQSIKEYKFLEVGYEDPFNVPPIFPSAIEPKVLEKLGDCQWMVNENTSKKD